MKRAKRTTRRERKAQDPGRPARAARAAQGASQHGHHHHHHGGAHIHCIACGKHLDPDQFGEPDGAEFIRCEHGTDFPACVGCHARAQALVEEHDRTDKPVEKAAAWH